MATKTCVECGREAIGENSQKQSQCLAHSESQFYGWTMYPIPRPAPVPPCVFGKREKVCGRPASGAGSALDLPCLPACPEHANKASFFRPYAPAGQESAAPASRIDHPPHYNAHPSGVEAIDLCELLPFCLGNAVKYLWRAGLKGAAVEDLQKAAWYLRRQAALSAHQPPVLLPMRAVSLAWKVADHEARAGSALRGLLGEIGHGTVRADGLRALAGKLEAEEARVMAGPRSANVLNNEPRPGRAG